MNYTKRSNKAIIIVHREKYYQQQLLEKEVDEGEASIISLAIEKENSLLIPDGQKARKLAAKLDIQYTRTLGVFLKAKERYYFSIETNSFGHTKNKLWIF